MNHHQGLCVHLLQLNCWIWLTSVCAFAFAAIDRSKEATTLFVEDANHLDIFPKLSDYFIYIYINMTAGLNNLEQPHETTIRALAEQEFYVCMHKRMHLVIVKLITIFPVGLCRPG